MTRMSLSIEIVYANAVLDIFLNQLIQLVSFGRPDLQLRLVVITEQKIEYKKKLQSYPKEIVIESGRMYCSMLKAWKKFFSDKYDTSDDAIIVHSINR